MFKYSVNSRQDKIFVICSLLCFWQLSKLSKDVRTSFVHKPRKLTICRWYKTYFLFVKPPTSQNKSLVVDWKGVVAQFAFRFSHSSIVALGPPQQQPLSNSELQHSATDHQLQILDLQSEDLLCKSPLRVT